MTNPYWPEISTALALAPGSFAQTKTGDLPSAYAVSDFASATVGAAGVALAQLLGLSPSEVTVDRRLASLWFDRTYSPINWDVPSIWDPIAGNYQTADGFIRLHTNAPHHRDRALTVLDCANTREAVKNTVKHWGGNALEAAIVGAGGCAAVMRRASQWHEHPQGIAVRNAPLVRWHTATEGPKSTTTFRANQPLQGLRVLDLTRVLAGPVASRFLAGFGADVLRIDPPHWNEPAVEVEVTLGKHCAGLDLHNPDDRATFETLLKSADVLLHGYRPGALEGLGYGPEARHAINPGLVDVSLSAYGRTGPWRERRGFDSLVQMSCGIADEGQRMTGKDVPVPLPVQALDHGAGYLLAATVLRGLAMRAEGKTVRAELSLARTAETLKSAPGTMAPADPIAVKPDDFDADIEHTSWGDAHRMKPPLTVAGLSPAWHVPAGHVRRHAAAWQN